MPEKFISEDKKRAIEYAHWNIPNLPKYLDLHSPTFNGFFRGEEELPFALMDQLLNPDYFYFTCKHIFNVELLPIQVAILKELWTRPFPMLIASRGFGKSFMLGLYALMRLLLTPGCKVVIVGAGFRQAKIIHEYMARIWYDAHLLRNICNNEIDKEQGPRVSNDRCIFRLGKSVCIAIPLGDGEKIRGLRAHYLICDEFACLGYNTIVETDKGLMRIGETQDRQDIKLLTGGDVQYEKPKNFVKTPITDAYKVTTKGGYSFICSSIHQVETMDGWKLCKDLTRDDYLPFENHYEFPKNYVQVDGRIVDENLAWILGLLLSEGSVASKYYFAVYMTDKNCINRFKAAIRKFDPSLHITDCEREAYVDDRGWKCKKSFGVSICRKAVRDLFEKMGLDRVTALDKKIPWVILQSPKSVVFSFLSALFEGDGSAFKWKDRKHKRLGVAYYSSSEQLCSEVQTLLKKLDLFSVKTSRVSKLSNNLAWSVRLNGHYAWKLFDMLKVPKWRHLEKIIERQKERKDNGIVYCADKKQRPWRLTCTLKGKNKFLGYFKTYEEAVVAYPSLRVRDHLRVRSVEKLPEQIHLYDYYLPQTHSFFGGCFRQHNTIPPEIYESVVSGFAIVSANPISNVKLLARRKVRQEMNMWSDHDEMTYDTRQSNQAVLAGTASYYFNHFARYWERYRAIVNSRGDTKKLETIMGGKVDENFNWKDYSVIRIPYDMLPKGFMDDKHISRAKATTNSSVYLREYSTIFISDSNGFFKRSLVESCVCDDKNQITQPSCGLIKFAATLKGHLERGYVMAIDPASEHDNFSIVILEVWPDHRRIVYCWTTTKNQHREKLKSGFIKEEDFYAYCCRKIRQLMQAFPIELIALDSQGGGFAIEEGLHDTDKMQAGENQIWQVSDPEKPKDSDGYSGLHILKMVNFSDATWTAQANHGMRKDFEDKALLFPFFDTISIAEAAREDGQKKRLFDTLEDCVCEIEDLKDELATIVHTQTPNGRDRWDTPEIKKAGGKRGRQRKDRYSALLMANMVGRQLMRAPQAISYEAHGGFTRELSSIRDEHRGPMFNGPSWFTEAMHDVY